MSASVMDWEKINNNKIHIPQQKAREFTDEHLG